MEKNRWMLLQLFAGEGAAGASDAGDGGQAASETGGNSADAGRRRLLELGVPESKIRKNRAYKVDAAPAGAVRTVQQTDEQKPEEQAAAAKPTEEAQEPAETAAPRRMTWKEIMDDPEYNREMQKVVKSRIAKPAQALEQLGPALELLARRHKMDPAKLDYAALANAVLGDDSYYEGKAMDMGVSVEVARKLEQKELDDARQQRNAELQKQQRDESIREQMIRNHHQNLRNQAEQLKATFPDFDLEKELENHTFVRLTAPNSGLSLEDAYYAVHRKELQAAAMQTAAKKTAEQISNAIQQGGRRPQEHGATGQAPSVSTFDYRKASPEQRDALKKRIREAAARGEKIYPGR